MVDDGEGLIDGAPDVGGPSEVNAGEDGGIICSAVLSQQNLDTARELRDHVNTASGVNDQKPPISDQLWEPGTNGAAAPSFTTLSVAQGNQNALSARELSSNQLNIDFLNLIAERMESIQNGLKEKLGATKAAEKALNNSIANFPSGCLTDLIQNETATLEPEAIRASTYAERTYEEALSHLQNASKNVSAFKSIYENSASAWYLLSQWSANTSWTGEEFPHITLWQEPTNCTGSASDAVSNIHHTAQLIHDAASGVTSGPNPDSKVMMLLSPVIDYIKSGDVVSADRAISTIPHTDLKDILPDINTAITTSMQDSSVQAEETLLDTTISVLKYFLFNVISGNDGASDSVSKLISDIEAKIDSGDYGTAFSLVENFYLHAPWERTLSLGRIELSWLIIVLLNVHPSVTEHLISPIEAWVAANTCPFDDTDYISIGTMLDYLDESLEEPEFISSFRSAAKLGFQDIFYSLSQEGFVSDLVRIGELIKSGEIHTAFYSIYNLVKSTPKLYHSLTGLIAHIIDKLIDKDISQTTNTQIIHDLKELKVHILGNGHATALQHVASQHLAAQPWPRQGAAGRVPLRYWLQCPCPSAPGPSLLSAASSAGYAAASNALPRCSAPRSPAIRCACTSSPSCARADAWLCYKPSASLRARSPRTWALTLPPGPSPFAIDPVKYAMSIPPLRLRSCLPTVPTASSCRPSRHHRRAPLSSALRLAAHGATTTPSLVRPPGTRPRDQRR